MAIDPHYIPAFSIEDVILDKDTGAPLSGGLVYFEQDNQRGVLKPVYQITGTSPNYSYIQLPNPMTLSAIGTFQDSLDNPVIPYFYPYDANGDPEYYYVRVTSSGDVPQFAREAVPYILGTGDTSIASAFVNELSNPQFAQVLFDTNSGDYVYNFNAVTQEVVALAPGWELVVSCSGAGSVTVSQATPQGTLNRLTNPGTLLNINSAGLSFLRLRQRLYGSPNLWGNNYLAGTFTAKTYAGTDSTLTLYYSQSNGAVVDEAIVSGILLANGLYQSYSGNVLIPASTSTDDFPEAYVDIEFEIPLSTEIEITSVMVAGTGGVSFNDLVYDQTPLDRQIDQLFHYYQPEINYKPIKSILTGWDFPLNPAQAKGGTATIITTPDYLWDQTIAQSVVGNIAVIRGLITGGLEATTAHDDEAFLLLQYLSGAEAKKILGTYLSSNLNVYRTSAGGDVTARVYLFRASSSAVIPALPALIGSLAADGTFTKNNTVNQGLNWTEIARGNLGPALGVIDAITIAGDIADVADLAFSGWKVTDSVEISNTDKFAIIVTFACPITATVVTVDSISVVPGTIPTRPAPQTPNEVLIDCAYYYQKSFNVGTTPAPNNGSNTGESQFIQGKGASTSVLGPNIKFPIAMRVDPTVTLYNPVAGNAQIRNYQTPGDYTLSTAINARQKGFSTSGTTNAGSSVGDESAVHWSADARLGHV